MDKLYYRHRASGGTYQVLGNGFVTLEGASPDDNDTIFVVNGGDAPPYVVVADERTQVRKDDLVLEVKLQTATPLKTGDKLVLYRGEDGRYWARPHAEFFDGRFVELDGLMQPVVLLDMAAVSVEAVKELKEQDVTVLSDGTLAVAKEADNEFSQAPVGLRGFGPLDSTKELKP